MNLFQLTRTLMDIPSPSGEEGEVGRFLASHLEGLGYGVELQEVEPGRANVLARLSARPRVVLSTHMDTVPPHIPSREDETHIHGRGACDAKGIMAAQLTAAERLREEGVEELGLLFTVDEEMGSLGARAAAAHAMGGECEYLINGEPTENRLAVGSKGSLRLKLRTEGRAAHSAYPEHGDSAIEKLLDVLQNIRAIEWPSDEFFGDTTCNIGVLNGGTRPNVIPDHARAELQIRLATDIERIKSVVEDAVGGRAQLEYASAHDPVRLFSVPGFDDCVVRFTTDVPYLSNWGKPLLIGPGSILDAHTEHERIAKHELERAIDLYVKLAKTL
jgi:acetylornithine deacetylase